jgi:MYXO-CTERM domain-containing protein
VSGPPWRREGSFVCQPGNVSLVAASGGGGAGITDHGHDAQLGQSGGSADPPVGGAGGSFNAPGSALIASFLRGSGNGSVFICVVEGESEAVPGIPTLSPWLLCALAVALLAAGALLLRRRPIRSGSDRPM